MIDKKLVIIKKRKLVRKKQLCNLLLEIDIESNI